MGVANGAFLLTAGDQPMRVAAARKGRKGYALQHIGTQGTLWFRSGEPAAAGNGFKVVPGGYRDSPSPCCEDSIYLATDSPVPVPVFFEEWF